MLTGPLDRSSSVSLAQQIARQMRDAIRGDVFADGQRIPDEKTLAQAFQVGRGTVRRALADLEGEGLIVRRKGKGTFVAGASRPNGGDVPSIGVLVWSEAFFSEVTRGASEEAHARGYLLSLASSGVRKWDEDFYDVASGDPRSIFESMAQREKELIDAFGNAGISGLLIAASSYPDPNLERIEDRLGVPVVLLVSMRQSGLEFVRVDNFEGAGLAVRHLYDLGHRSIAHITHEAVPDMASRPERLTGFREYCTLCGLPSEACPVLSVPTFHGDTLQRLMADFIRDHPSVTAYFCYSDYFAAHLVRAALALGLRVGEDISVVGLDDSDIARSCAVPLTSVSGQWDTLGRLAVRRVIERIEYPASVLPQGILTMPELVVRESTGPPCGVRTG